jgi:UDP-GlcNAc:undecaprenyl-phosphate/decaprenyl-phosphate GlcNAc-1-phosphate transferase
MLYFFAFLIAFIGTALFTPFSMYIAKRFDVLDYPKARKVHRVPLPRWGGIGIYLGFFASILILLLFSGSFHKLLGFNNGLISTQLQGICIGATIVFVLGLIDDKKSIPAAIKLLVQIIAAFIAMDYGVRILGLNLPFFGHFVAFPQILGIIISILWIVGFMNTINLADGLDGLAAGIVAIASGTFLVVAVLQSNTKILLLSKQLALSAVLASALVGACLGFLLYNFHPAKVFMGDSGALFLGFILASMSAVGTLKTTAVLAIFIPITVVALPVLDVAMSIYRRMRKGMGVMEADNEHIHHRLLNFGWTHKEVVLLMYVLTLILSIGSILMAVVRIK